VDDNIAKCIELMEVALHRPDNPAPSTRNRAGTPHHPTVAIGNVFSGIDRVDQGIADCINLAEITLQRINPREPKAFDLDFDDFIRKLKTPRPNSSRSEAVLPRTLSASEEDLDHLLQRRGSHRRSGGYRFRRPLGFSHSRNAFNRQPSGSGKRINSVG
jgi:hypothetical protein